MYSLAKCRAAQLKCDVCNNESVSVPVILSCGALYKAGSQWAQDKIGERVANLMTYTACTCARVLRYVTGTHSLYEWDTCVDPWVGLDVLQMRKIPSPVGIQTPYLPARTPITIPTAIHWLLVINTVRSFPHYSLPISCRTPSHQQ